MWALAPFVCAYRSGDAAARRGKPSKREVELARKHSQRLHAERDRVEKEVHAARVRAAKVQREKNRSADIAQSDAATKLQCMWRGRAAKKEVAKKKRERERAPGSGLSAGTAMTREALAIGNPQLQVPAQASVSCVSPAQSLFSCLSLLRRSACRGRCREF